MKDKMLFISGLVWTVWAILAGFVFYGSEWEFPIRQACEVYLLVIISILTHKKYPLANIVFFTLSALSLCELVDEVKTSNTTIRLDDYIFVAFGLIGLISGIFNYLKLKQKQNATNPG